ncbi:LptM family lipoprotein [Agathobaculum sp. Marseille-P7918]|uniref:LptM family lipoprotein n=1 Tax=Agathobaculum sp. Marseille-P7918 TaxID=2479843 RepID=UPI000F64193A|nr:hypothetical protein [Agathobaculum sp. Marseille-P7918]
MKKFIAVLLIVASIFTLAGCREASRVKYNVSKEADNFNVERRLSVINARTDKPLLELTGFFSISNNSDSELVVTCQTGENEFKVNYVYLNEWTLYVVEDVSGASVDPYHYEINFLPEMIQPVTITSSR